MYYLLGAEMPLAMRFFIAFLVLLFLVGLAVYLVRVLLRRRTVLRAGEGIDRAISEVLHKAYDRRDTGGASNNRLTEQLAKLAKLHADGVLTAEQFRSLKAGMLSEEGTSDAGASASQPTELDRAISDVVHKTYDHRDIAKEPANNGITAKLTKIAQLRAEGALSNEEFESIKAKLIYGIAGNADDRKITKAHKRTWVETIIVLFVVGALGWLFYVFVYDGGLHESLEHISASLNQGIPRKL